MLNFESIWSNLESALESMIHNHHQETINMATATLTISSPDFATNPDTNVPEVFSWTLDESQFKLPAGITIEASATSPKGTLTENIKTIVKLGPFTVYSGTVAKLPMDLPGFLGDLAPIIEAVDATIDLKVA